MKYFLIAVITAMVFSSCILSKKVGRTDFITVSDTETKVLKGSINRSVLEKDTAFGWFTGNMKYGAADVYAVDVFKQKASQFSVLVFAGTWCHDSQNLLPKLYRLFDISGFPESKVTLIAVDRKKTALNDLPQKWNLQSVPTFIIVQNGKEMGRVVEYGKTGNMERELAEIVAGLK
jgi:thiol-disulfide isomerase/thioredoxin